MLVLVFFFLSLLVLFIHFLLTTHGVLHLLAIAQEAGVELNIDDFDRISSKTPMVCDLKPGGRYVAKDVFDVGGIPLILKALLDGGYLHGDCLTVTNPSSSSTGPYYVKAEACTSDTNPSIAQTWGWGNDFGNVIFWTGGEEWGAGVNLKDDGTPMLGSRDRIQLVSNGTYESFILTKTQS